MPREAEDRGRTAPTAGPDAVRLDLTEDIVRQMVPEYPYHGGALVLDTEQLTPGEYRRPHWATCRPQEWR
jgi:hypothetical protein